MRFILFYSYRFSEIARLIDIIALFNGNIIGEELLQSIKKNRREMLDWTINADNVIGVDLSLRVSQDDSFTATSADFVETTNRFVEEPVIENVKDFKESLIDERNRAMF